MPGVPMGSHRLVLRHIAYGEHSRVLTLDEASTVDFRVRISRQAIELAPLEVEVRSDADLARRASGNSFNVVERPTIEAFSQQGASLVYMLESEVPGIRVNGPCVEFRLQSSSGAIGRPDPDMPGLQPGGANINSTCRALTLYVDGARSSEDLLQISLDELERVQVLSSSEAGVRYGLAGGAGVILLETRRGVAPDAPAPIVKVTGFAWQEPNPYPWARVLATSFAGVAMNVALTYVGVGSCLQDELDDIKLTKCGSVIPSVAGLMTGTVSSLMTSWAGKTSLSRGRALPSLAAGALSAVTGYVLYSKGEDRGSSRTQTAGIVTLTIGTPALLILTDRVFRQLR
jgi:hypothetical protein